MPFPAPAHCSSVPLAKAYRVLNHGPVVLVSSAHGDTPNLMAAAWSMPLDFDPPKVTVVIDKATLTRQLVEASGVFGLNIPCAAMAAQTLAVGTDSAHTVPGKLAQHGITTFAASQIAAPLVQGCVGWLVSCHTRYDTCMPDAARAAQPGPVRPVYRRSGGRMGR